MHYTYISIHCAFFVVPSMFMNNATVSCTSTVLNISYLKKRGVQSPRRNVPLPSPDLQKKNNDLSMMKDVATLQRRQKGARHTGNIDVTGKHTR